MSLLGGLGRSAGLFLGLVCALPVLADDITVATKYGDVTVSDKVERIVTVHEGALDAAFALGFEPIGAISTRGGDGVASYIQETAKNVNIVGTSRETNLEAVIAQRPDIILASYRLPAEQYALLSKIAPTIVPQGKGIRPDGWIREMRVYAKALNREQKAEQIIQAVADRAAQIKTQLETKLPADQRGAALIRWMPQGALVLTTQFFTSGLLAQAGFEVTDSGLIKRGRPHSSPLSLENLSKIDNDWIFMATLDEEGQKALDAAKQSPAFARLDVVKRDHVIPVDGQLWTSASGPIAANAILDDIQNVLDSKVQ
ncbi:ABC transporter substrate-binding protein [Marinomonas aquiplantarum]|uniref:Iron complex transport system substrate-binding protein n=1 Tax=Marinomonas aquiplantarum TaxID=491951 RepID=A0A366D1R8_9GAMM|nr:iron-siderophore ABC transporter substrate-binding protein [Marinomonas aquiplantarum]RBO84020.1 iron complex transport system substrate-binding protein [Marinomonas aquiplantarum]